MRNWSRLRRMKHANGELTIQTSSGGLEAAHSYSISRFLLCKYLVRGVNTALGNNPLTKLAFFAGLRRARYGPFYTIPGIRGPEDLGTVDDDDTEGIVLIKGSRNDRYPHMLRPLLYLHRIIHIRR